MMPLSVALADDYRSLTHDDACLAFPFSERL